MTGAAARASTVAVVTIVHGRHDHLEHQLWGLRHQTVRPDLHVAVAIDDDGIEPIARGGAGGWAVHVPTLGRRRGRLPLSAARNLGVETAARAGADVLILLDVDCIPSPGVVERYATVLDDGGAGIPEGQLDAPTVVSGEVAYLPALRQGSDLRDLDLDALAAPHAARPRLGRHDVQVAEDLRLFWSLSFALSVSSWQRIGGFDESYVGYGAEDTDFGQRIRASGGRLLWVGGARAHHQHHPTSSPPVQHVDDIVANANRFAQRWGWWPMEGWLDAFAERGLASRAADGTWRLAD